MLFIFFYIINSAISGWTNYTSFANVNKLIHSQNKLIIASDGGVCLRDNSGYSTLNNSDALINNNTIDAVLNSQNYLFAATISGLSIFSEDLQQNLNLISYIHGIPYGKLTSIVERYDSVWVFSEENGWFWDTKGDPLNFISSNTKSFLQSTSIRTADIYNNNIYIGTIGRLIEIPVNTFEDESTYTYYSNGLLTSDTILSIVEYNNIIWIGTTKGVAYLSGDSFIFSYNRYCHQIAVINDSLFITDFDNWEIKIYRNNSWTGFGAALPSKPTALAVNSAGEITAGTEKYGSYSYSQNQWEYASPPSLWQSGVTTAAMLSNGILCATHGLAGEDALSIRFPNGDWEIVKPVNNGSWGTPRFVLPYKDTAFIVGIWGSPGGLAIIHPDSDSSTVENILFPIALSTQPVSGMYVDDENNVWCSLFTSDAPYIYCYKPDGSWNSYFSNNFIYIYSFMKLIDNRIAFGTAHLNANGYTAVFNPVDSSVSAEISGLAGNDINSICNGKGDTVFIASTGGINSVLLTSLKVVDTLTTNDGLIGTSVSGVEYIKGNGLWALCENSGMSHRKTDGTWENFDYATYLAGMPLEDNRSGLFYQEDSNLLIVSSSGGVSIKKLDIIPEKEHDNVEIYPNPWLLNTNITFSGNPGELFIYSLDGSLIFENSTDSYGILTIDSQELSDIKSGLYFVIIKSENIVQKGRLVIVR